MKNIKINSGKLLILLSLGLFFSGCTLAGLDVQKDYDYQPSIIPDHINMSAWEYLKMRANGTPTNPKDTVFRWMKKAIDYSGIDTNEYMKPNRTYIFLHNDAIKKYDTKTKVITGGFFLTFPILQKDPNGNVVLDPITQAPITVPTTKWEQYDKQTVKNYLLYLIAEGDYNYNNLTPTPVTLQTLLPAGSVATKESKLGYMVTPSSIAGTTNGDDTTTPTFIYNYTTGGNGFDPEGKLTLQLGNTFDSKLYLNSYLVVRSSGYYATNGSIHVWDGVIIPSR